MQLAAAREAQASAGATDRIVAASGDRLKSQALTCGKRRIPCARSRTLYCLPRRA
jgi:hypothetical protein